MQGCERPLLCLQVEQIQGVSDALEFREIKLWQSSRRFLLKSPPGLPPPPRSAFPTLLLVSPESISTNCFTRLNLHVRLCFRGSHAEGRSRLKEQDDGEWEDPFLLLSPYPSHTALTKNVCPSS